MVGDKGFADGLPSVSPSQVQLTSRPSLSPSPFSPSRRLSQSPAKIEWSLDSSLDCSPSPDSHTAKTDNRFVKASLSKQYCMQYRHKNTHYMAKVYVKLYSSRMTADKKDTCTHPQ